MKNIVAIVALVSIFAGFSAFAGEAADSFAIFHSPNQVIALVNEKGGAKLGQIFVALGVSKEEVSWEAPNKDVKITCKRSLLSASQEDAYSCTFRFVSSEEVSIGKKSMIAKIGTEDESAVKYFDLNFINVQNESFKIKMTSSFLSAETNK